MRSSLKCLLAAACLAASALAIGAVASEPMGPPDTSFSQRPDVDPISLRTAGDMHSVHLGASRDIDPIFLTVADSGAGAASALKAFEAKRQLAPPRSVSQWQHLYPDVKPDTVLSEVQRQQLRAVARLGGGSSCVQARGPGDGDGDDDAQDNSVLT